jgi:hypothetical protein
MKKCLVALSVAALLGLSVTARAQVDENTTLVLTSVAYTYAKADGVDNSLKGAAFVLVWEQVTWDRQMSIGFGGSYGTSWFDRGVDRTSFRRIPFYATFKGLIGPPKYTGYIGIGVGATIDRLEVTGVDGIEMRKDEANFSLLVPLGIYLAPNPKVGFNFNVSYMWANTGTLENNSMFAFAFGVAFLM